MKLKDFDLEDFLSVLFVVLPVVVLCSLPVIFVGKIVTTQQALNQECKTNYNLLQVALAEDNLSRICQMKNQTLTIK